MPSKDPFGLLEEEKTQNKDPFGLLEEEPVAEEGLAKEGFQKKGADISYKGYTVNDPYSNETPGQPIGNPFKTFAETVRTTFARQPGNIETTSAMMGSLSLDRLRQMRSQILAQQAASYDPEARQYLNQVKSQMRDMFGRSVSSEEADVMLPDIEMRINQKSKAVEKALQYAISSNANINQKEMVDRLSKINNPMDFLNYVANATGEAISQIPLSIVTFGASSFVQSAGDSYLTQVQSIAEAENLSIKEVIDKGLDEPAIAAANSQFSSSLDRLGAGKIHNILSKSFLKNQFRKKTLDYAGGVVTEAGTEAVQTGLEQRGGLQPIDWTEIGEAAVKGGIGSSVISAPSLAPGDFSTDKDKTVVDNIQPTRQVVDKIDTEKERISDEKQAKTERAIEDITGDLDQYMNDEISLYDKETDELAAELNPEEAPEIEVPEQKDPVVNLDTAQDLRPLSAFKELGIISQHEDVLSWAEENGISINIEENIPDAYGSFDRHDPNVINLNRTLLSQSPKDLVDTVVAHEVVHAMVDRGLRNASTRNSVWGDLTQLKSTYLDKQSLEGAPQGVLDMMEVIQDENRLGEIITYSLTDPEVAKWMDGIEVAREKGSEVKSVWQTIKQAIRTLAESIGVEGTALDKVTDILDKYQVLSEQKQKSPKETKQATEGLQKEDQEGEAEVDVIGTDIPTTEKATTTLEEDVVQETEEDVSPEIDEDTDADMNRVLDMMEQDDLGFDADIVEGETSTEIPAIDNIPEEARQERSNMLQEISSQAAAVNRTQGKMGKRFQEKKLDSMIQEYNQFAEEQGIPRITDEEVARIKETGAVARDLPQDDFLADEDIQYMRVPKKEKPKAQPIEGTFDKIDGSKTLYHGSNVKIESIDDNVSPILHLTEDKNLANEFAKDNAKIFKGEPVISEVVVEDVNLLKTKDTGQDLHTFGDDDSGILGALSNIPLSEEHNSRVQELIQDFNQGSRDQVDIQRDAVRLAQEIGYDGIVYENTAEGLEGERSIGMFSTPDVEYMKAPKKPQGKQKPQDKPSKIVEVANRVPVKMSKPQFSSFVDRANAKLPEGNKISPEDANKAWDLYSGQTTDQVLEAKRSELLKKTDPKAYRAKGGKFPKGKTLDVETIEKLSGINEIMKSVSIEDAQSEIAKITEGVYEQDGNALTDEQVDRIESLNFAGIKDMDQGQLDYAMSEINNLISEGKTKFKKRREEEKALVDNIKQSIANVLSGGKGITPNRMEVQTKINKDAEKKVSLLYSEFFNKMESWDSLLDKLSVKDKGSEAFESDINKLVGDLVQRAQQQENQGKIDASREVASKINEIFGDNAYKELQRNKTEYQDFVFTDSNGNPRSINMTINQAYKKWMEAQDPSLDNTFKKEGLDRNNVASVIEGQLDPKVIQWAKWQLEEFYPKYYEGINKVFKQEFGYSLPKNEFYSPIERSTDSASETNVLEFENPLETVLNASLYSRKNNTKTLKIVDGDDVLSRYITKMEHFKAWNNPVSIIRKTLMSGDIKRTIAFHHGKPFNNAIASFVNDFARGGISQEMVVNWLDQLRKNYTTAVLGLNFPVFLKQLTSIPAYMAEIPVGAFSNGLYDFAKNPKKAIDVLSNTAFMKDRAYGGHDRDVRLAMSRDAQKMLTGKRNWRDKIMFLTRWGDAAAIYVGGWGVYKHHYDKTLRESGSVSKAKKVAEEKFIKATRMSQQSSSVGDLSYYQRTSTFGKLFTMFLTSPMQYFRHTSTAFRNLKAGRGSKKKNLKRLLVYNFILPSIFSMTSGGLKGLFADEDTDEEEREQLLKRYAMQSMLGSLNGMFLVGPMLENSLMLSIGENFKFNATPLGGLGGDMASALSNLGETMNEVIEEGELDPDQAYKSASEIVDLAGKVTGTPIPSIRRHAEASYQAYMSEDLPAWDRLLLALGYSEYSLGIKDKD